MTSLRSVVVVHLDESCLGNGREGDTPGGAGGLIEVRTGSGIQRREFFLHAPDTTNNRMALAGAVTVLDLLGAKGHRLRVLIVSDSEYLVRGVREWLPGWMAKGWRRKSGPIENLELWQALAAAIEKHEVTFSWVRGHNGHPKNEYANDLAIGAARNQITSEGAVASPFLEWLAAARKKKRYIDYDPDRAFDQLATLVRSNRVLPLALEHATSGAHAGEMP